MLGAAAAISGPTSDAFTPDLVPEADLHAANAMESTLRSLAVRMAGPAIGGLLVSAVSPLTIIAINAASFVSAAVCVWLINTKQAPPTGTSTVASAPPQPPSEPVSYCHAWRYLVGERWLWVLILWSGVVLLLQSGPRQVLLPLISHYDLGGSARDYGLLVAVTGISAVVASIAVGSRTPPSDYPRWMLLSWTVGAAPLALMFNIPSFWMLLPLGAISGCFSTIGNIYWSTLIQTVVPSTVLGRVISIDWLGSLALVPLSAVLAGASTAAHISHWLFILGGALPILFTVATLRWVRLPATRSAARSEAEPCAPSAAA